MTKLFGATIIILTTLILGVVVSGCVKKPVPQPHGNQPVNSNQNVNTATTTAEIDTSDWKTYRNEEYGFEFKYPESISDIKFQLYEWSGKYAYEGEELRVTLRPLIWQDTMFDIAIHGKGFTMTNFNKSYADRWLSEKIVVYNRNVDGRYIISGAGNNIIKSHALFIEGKNFNFEIMGGGCLYTEQDSPKYCKTATGVNIVEKIISTIQIF